MILRFISESIRRAPRRKALIIAAIAMGSAVATAMLGVMLDIGDKINHELRNAGANILVPPRNGYIAEADVPKVKGIFWTLAILGYTPSLSAQDAGLPVEGVWFRNLPAVNPAADFNNEEDILLYSQLPTQTAYGANFYDITTGNNGCFVGKSWDYCTGVGSPRGYLGK